MSNITNRLNKVLRICNNKKLTDVAYKTFREETPYRTGNAFRKTIKGTNTINANYAYATLLDQGYSDQSPDGMTKPTIEAVRDYINTNLGGKL